MPYPPRRVVTKETRGDEAPAASRPTARREVAFLLKFLGLLTLFFLSVAPKPMNDRVVEPFTGLVAHAGGAVCRLFGEDARMIGTMISSPRFAVNIRNGCNGLETMFIFAAAVLAFPAPWRVKLWGLLAGVAAIQALNLVRIVSLFFIGVHWPALFEKWHVVVWQVIVILFGVALFLVWADRFALPPQPSRPAPAR